VLRAVSTSRLTRELRKGKLLIVVVAKIYEAKRR
jgi:hypothetical protein